MNTSKTYALNSKTSRTDVFGIKALIVLSAFIAAFNSGSIQAGEDGKIYSGNMCRPTGSPVGGYAPYVHYNTDGSISNTSEQFSVTVDCPIVRDNMSNKDGLKSVILYYDDQNPYYNFFCTVHSRWKWGNHIVKSQNGTIINNFGISYLHVLGVDISRGANTFYTMRCVIPRKYPGKPNSRLLNYTVTEGDRTWGS